MSSEYILHRTKDGERWDYISFKYYGTVSKQGFLIASNRHLFSDTMEIPSILKAGLVLTIPILQRSVAVDPSRLPLWKQ